MTTSGRGNVVHVSTYTQIHFGAKNFVRDPDGTITDPGVFEIEHITNGTYLEVADNITQMYMKTARAFADNVWHTWNPEDDGELQEHIRPFVITMCHVEGEYLPSATDERIRRLYGILLSSLPESELVQTYRDLEEIIQQENERPT